MGKWIWAGLLALIGFSLLTDYPLVGIVMLGIAGLIIFLSVRGSGSSRGYTPPARPAQLSSARYDAREEISRAERDAARMIRAAQEDAESDGREALRSAMTYLSQEPRWV